MNNVILTGRLTKDPVVSYTQTEMAVARFSLAVSWGKDKDGNEQTDYPNCVAFGKTAEVVEKYTAKGSKLLVQGRIQTGSYDKDGQKVYTTNVVADRVEFLDPKGTKKEVQMDIKAVEPEFIEDDEIPF